MYTRDLIWKPLGQKTGSLVWHLKERSNLFGLILFFHETAYLKLHLKSINLTPFLRSVSFKMTKLCLQQAGSRVTTMKMERKLQAVMGIYIKLDPS